MSKQDPPNPYEYLRLKDIEYSMPDPANGLFRTEREARLYYLGYLSLFLDYYIEDTIEAIREAIHEYSQQTLF